MQQESIESMRMLYGRLLGLQATLSGYVPLSMAKNYIDIVNRIFQLLDEDGRWQIEGLQIEENEIDRKYGSVEEHNFKPKLFQIISWMEQKFGFAQKVVSLGSLVNEISDPDLKTRSIEIMALTGHYDIPVNQATLVFESRMRKKAKYEGKESGVGLCNKLIKSDQTESIIIVSRDPAIQEGFANMCRGVMQYYRNETHHRLVEMSKEDAMKICAFIDLLLKGIDGADVRSMT